MESYVSYLKHRDEIFLSLRPSFDGDGGHDGLRLCSFDVFGVSTKGYVYCTFVPF